MATLVNKPKLDFNIQLNINYDEAAALDALAGYDFNEFLKIFYKEMGKSYLEPHAAGLRSLFLSVRAQLPLYIERFEQAKGVLDGTRKVGPQGG